MLVILIGYVDEVVSTFGLEDVLLRRLVELPRLCSSLVLREEEALLVLASSVVELVGLQVLLRRLYYVRRAWPALHEARSLVTGGLSDLRWPILVLGKGDATSLRRLLKDLLRDATALELD